MATTIVVIAGVLRRWKDLLKIKQLVQDNWGDTVLRLKAKPCVVPVNFELTTQERRRRK